jgi:hypothetical protein
MIERCGDRQRKCNGLQKWPFHFFVESLPVMLQVALLLLACGLCRYMVSINTPVAGVLIALTVFGVLFYAGIVIAGASSYDCPFQAPGSGTLRSLWMKIGPYLTHASLQIITTLCDLGEIVQCHIFRIEIRLPHIDIRRHFRGLLEIVQLRILHIGLGLPRMGLNIRRRLRHPPLPTVQENSRPTDSQGVVPWLTPKDLTTIRMTSADDARCISWILWNITDPEALDAAIRLAGTIRWFERGTDEEPPYDLIVSTFQTCFGSDRVLYPGSRDRAYYSGRAILWIHALARCKSKELARSFPLPISRYSTPDRDDDLRGLLSTVETAAYSNRDAFLFIQRGGGTLSHSRWISNAMLHLSWANRTAPSFKSIHFGTVDKTTVSVDTILNRLLTWCILFGSPVEEEALKVQDKSCGIICFLPFGLLKLFFTSDRLERILRKLSDAIVSALNTAHPQCKLIPAVLRNLTQLETRPHFLTEMAYEWCSVICKNRRSCEGWSCRDLDCKCWKSLVLRSLEIGFRHLEPPHWWSGIKLNHTEHHRELPDMVFKSKESEVIADLLQAWTIKDFDGTFHQASTLLDTCTGYLVGLHDLVPFSPRLRRLVVRSVGHIDYKGFMEGETERFVELLNHLHVCVEDMGNSKWMPILLDVVQSPEGTRSLSVQSWVFLAELTVSYSWVLEDPVYSPQVMASLLEAQEWERLECWMGVVWMVWPPRTNATIGDLEHVMVSLFHQRPGAVQKLTQWMEQWGTRQGEQVPEAFKRICSQLQEPAQLGAP